MNEKLTIVSEKRLRALLDTEDHHESLRAACEKIVNECAADESCRVCNALRQALREGVGDGTV